MYSGPRGVLKGIDLLEEMRQAGKVGYIDANRRIISTRDIEDAGSVDEFYKKLCGYSRADLIEYLDLMNTKLSAEYNLEKLKDTHDAIEKIPE